MSKTDRAARRLHLQGAHAVKQQRLANATAQLASRSFNFQCLQQERAERGTSVVVSRLHSDLAGWLPNFSTKAFSEALGSRLKRQSYEPAVTGALRDALELDELHHTIATLSATSTAQYANFA